MNQKLGLAFSDKIKLFTALFVVIFSLAAVGFSVRFNLRAILVSGNENNITIGWVLAVIFIFLCLYSLKKRMLVMFYGELSKWYNSHFYIALISIVLLIIHSEFSPGFGINRIISFLLLWIVLNGLYGVIMHSFIPGVLLKHNIEIININQMTEKKDQLREKINQIIKDKSESFIKIYNFYIKECIQKTTGTVDFLTSNFIKKNNLSNQLISLVAKENELPEKERSDYHKLLAIYGKGYELENHLFMIRLMNNWIYYHISITTILFFLVTIHVLSFYYY